MSKKRSIFEDVEGDSKAGASAVVGVIDKAPKSARGMIKIWLALVFLLIAANVLLGVLNRKGAMGPDQVFWLAFVVWAVGFIVFLSSNRLPVGWMGRMICAGVLTGFLALTHWWGTTFYGVAHIGDVDSYKILFQRGLAFAAMGVIVWYILQLGRSEADMMTARRARSRRLWILSAVLVVLAMVQILRGGILAGVSDGDAFTDWPLIEGQIIPAGLFAMEPFWLNPFENPVLAQFSHRMAGFVLLIFGAYTWLRSRKTASSVTRRAYSLMLVIMLVQLGLGAAVVMTGGWWHGALTFQVGAIVLWVLILRARFLTGYPVAQSVRD